MIRLSVRLLAAAAIGILLFFARIHLGGPGVTPQGQSPLTLIKEVEAFRTEFNQAADRTRLIVLLAPTCPYCLKGARTLQQILDRHASQSLAVYVIWQPMLPTDWGRPGTSVLSRLSDARVHQYWNANHAVARLVGQAGTAYGIEPGCCVSRDIWWDLVAVFPPGGLWNETLPKPSMIDGTLEDAAASVEAALGAPPVRPRQD
jgi:hypothetical protein